jgi:hypothetical protein
MVKASFEHEGNTGLLTIVTHFGDTVKIACDKRDDEQFRLGGTAINDVACYEGVVLHLTADRSSVPFRAFRSVSDSFDGRGVLSGEPWDVADLHCYITEHYSLDMEGKKPGWFISKSPIKDAFYLFVNLDVLDGGSNVVKRYRVSPFTGEYVIMESTNA